jgi:hypothetical protein
MLEQTSKRTVLARQTQAWLRKRSIEEIGEIIGKLEAANGHNVVVAKHRLEPSLALPLAYKVKGALHRGTLNPSGGHDCRPIGRTFEYTRVPDRHCLPPPAPAGPWAYASADDLATACPCEEEITQIRADFNIYFEMGLVDHGVLTPWCCTTSGSESSIMLSLYNIFRLAQCIPFSTSFPWATTFTNLYDWLKSLQLVAIGFFWAESGESSWGWDKWVHLRGNNFGDPIYRDIVNPQCGVGLVDVMVLLAHESRHAGDNIPHNCGSNDSDLGYMGAWAVQYYLLKMMAENTGDFFSDYAKMAMSDSADEVLRTRFGNV